MSDYKYTIVQDGILLKKDIGEKFKGYFTYRDIKSNNKGDFLNFVGFIFAEEEALVSFPKHFFSKEALSEINENPFVLDPYLEILFKIIQKTMSRKNKRLLHVQQEMNKSYPFEAFNNIHQYYQKYGLFTQDREVKKIGCNGKISWKDTFNKSSLVINNGNLLFMPPVVQKRLTDYVFVSKCMAYVINRTIERFPFLFKFPRVNIEYRDIDFKNSEKMIKNLIEIKQYLFKDIHLRLIEDLIVYFKNHNHGSKHLEIKIYSFYSIWEDMIAFYLNNYFLKVDNESEELIFEKTGVNNHHFQKREFEVDSRRKSKSLKTYKIEPDYYFDDGENRYIFDAKYYTRVNQLDYKQISYYFLLKNFESDNKLNIYNALILPTSDLGVKSIHFHLDKEFCEADEEFKILECYLNMQEIIHAYLNNC